MAAGVESSWDREGPYDYQGLFLFFGFSAIDIARALPE
jgi:hypothetical protein